jgi:hypothetical protein
MVVKRKVDLVYALNFEWMIDIDRYIKERATGGRSLAFARDDVVFGDDVVFREDGVFGNAVVFGNDVCSYIIFL